MLAQLIYCTNHFFSNSSNHCPAFCKFYIYFFFIFLPVTGASFVVFNGALKASTGLRAKSSIVEDGLMIQVLPETLASLKQALVDMTGFTIQCGPADIDVPEESVEVRWVENDKGFNIG